MADKTRTRIMRIVIERPRSFAVPDYRSEEEQARVEELSAKGDLEEVAERLGPSWKIVREGYGSADEAVL
jgi:hypothetical protein